MSLNIECGSLTAECLNAPSDVYLYFDGGFFVWNCDTSEPLSIWFNGDQFYLTRYKYTDAHDAVVALNDWVQKQLIAP
jgi:hypothetical protein